MFSSAIIVLPLMAAPMALAQTYASTTTFTFAGAALPTGLVASNWPIGEAPYQHEYKPENAVVSDGFLNLIVYGGQEGDEVITSAEVSTDFTVASARVETYAILTDVPGVCNGTLWSGRIKRGKILTCLPGMYFYESDNQEVDIEWLSDPASQSNIDSGRGRALFYTNQAVTPGSSSTSETGEEPSDAFSAVHNYRVDWDGKTSTFYLDNKLQYQFKTNVPTAKDGHWMWNNWS
jgi:hypothetical protein